MVRSNLQSVVSLLRPAKPGEALPPDFVPGPKDVCSGRGKRNWNHVGNIAFRNMVQSHVEDYMTAPNKNEKTAIVCRIVDKMRRDGCRFLQQNKQGLWYDIGDAKARDKVGHSLRDQVTAINRGQAQLPSKRETKPPQQPAPTSTMNVTTTMEQMQQLYEQERQQMALSDNEAEAEESHRRRSVVALPEIVKFARRPSWVAGESLSSSEGMEGVTATELERRRSSWGILMEGNVLEDLMEIDVHEDDHGQQHAAANISIPTTTATDMSAFSSTIPDPTPVASAASQQPGNDQWPPAMPPRTELVSTDSQIALLMEEGDEFDVNAEPNSPQRLPNRGVVADSTGLMRDSMKSWDPRISGGTSLIGEARMDDVFRSSSGEGSGGNINRSSRRPTVRFSGATLRRATNNFRLSDLSMASDLFDGLADWGSQPAGDDSINNFDEL